MHLREFLMRQYQKQGWMVCTDDVEMDFLCSGGWSGAHPDMLLTRGNRKIAVCIETAVEHAGDYLAKKWRSILDNPGVSLLVVVREEHARDAVFSIANRHDIELECKMVKKTGARTRRVIDDTLKRRTRLFALVLFLLVAFIAVMIVLPSARNSIVPGYYQPHDMERQINSLKKELNKLEGGK